MKRSTIFFFAFVAITGLILSLATAVTLPVSGRQTDGSYAYHSARFTEFVNDSFREGGSGSARMFYDWMDNAYTTSKFHYPGKERLKLEQVLDEKRFEITSITDKKIRTKAEINLGAWLHRMVKTTIPKFSLDRGFEFRHTVAYGERQCFLQSVLIAGMLQRAGVDAGVAMVYKNIAGQETNNGHAVTLVKLTDGRDIIVDASEPMPFARHRGLFSICGGYRYIEPVYERKSNMITGYILAANRSHVKTARVGLLDTKFLDSQFWYYRGERAPRGLLAAHPTNAGLKSSARALQMSVKLCPQNPLAVYMLGRTYFAQGNIAKARKQFARASSLYTQFGWTPKGIKDYASKAAN